MRDSTTNTIPIEALRTFVKARPVLAKSACPGCDADVPWRPHLVGLCDDCLRVLRPSAPAPTACATGEHCRHMHMHMCMCMRIMCMCMCMCMCMSCWWRQHASRRFTPARRRRRIPSVSRHARAESSRARLPGSARQRQPSEWHDEPGGGCSNLGSTSKRSSSRARRGSAPACRAPVGSAAFGSPAAWLALQAAGAPAGPK